MDPDCVGYKPNRVSFFNQSHRLEGNREVIGSIKYVCVETGCFAGEKEFSLHDDIFFDCT